jgi:hypothetical protein
MGTEKHARLASPDRVSRLDMMLKCLLGMTLLCICYFMVYHSVNYADSSDVIGQLRDAMKINRRNIVGQYLTGQDILWHTLVRCVYLLPDFTRYDAACLVTSVTYASYYFICCAVLEREEMQLPDGLIPVACFVLCLVGPIYMPWYSERIYLGQDSPNPWHSPTQIMVKPFALLLFVMTAMLYNRLKDEKGNYALSVYRSKKEAAAYTILIVLSEYAKPSCFQIIVPGLGILMLIDLIRSRGKSLLFSLKMAAAFVPGAILTAMKFFTAFYVDQGSGGVEIAPFVVWRHYTKSIPISFLLLFAFPAFVFIMDHRNFLKHTEGPLAVSVLASGMLMKGMLAEMGKRRWHGNFGWGYGLAATLVWFVAVKKFIRMMTGDELSPKEYKIAAYVGYSLLALHFITGIIYLIMLGTGTRQC